MKIIRTFALFPCAFSLALLGLVAAPERVSTAATPSDGQPERLKRADSFLGVHFDFHAGPDCTEIGKNTTREMIGNIINLVGPDYLQIDCKGHRGLSSYPTKVGNHPEFELCSNWAYTDHMAEPVSAPLDFLSGDYSPDDSVNSARVSARYLARQGVSWDLMAWSFSRKVRDQGQSPQKTAVQLQREAAVVLALGGGFQAYFKQKRDGSVFDEQIPVMAEVAQFCRERQALCHRAEAVPQVALLLSTAGHYRRINGLFSRDLGRLSGVLQALLESQHRLHTASDDDSPSQPAAVIAPLGRGRIAATCFDLGQDYA